MNVSGSWGKYFFYLGLCILIIMGFRLFVFSPLKVMTEVLEPTLLKGDYIFLNRWKVTQKKLQRGDIVAVDLKLQDTDFDLMRIVAMAGDLVEVKSGALYVNSQPSALRFSVDVQLSPTLVGPQQFYMLGGSEAPGRIFLVLHNQILGSAHWIWFSVEQRDALAEPPWKKIRWHRIFWYP